MSKRSLIERMVKKRAPQAWVAEVKALVRTIEEKDAKIREYGEIIDTLARQADSRGLIIDKEISK